VKARAKKWIIVTLVVLLFPILLFCAGIGIAYYYQDEIVQKALVTINKEFDGKLEVRESTIAPFAAFPYISIDLKGVRFYGLVDGLEHELYHVEDLYLGFDFWKIIQGQAELKSLLLRSGSVDLIKHPDGQLNLLRAKRFYDPKEEEPSSDNSLSIDLKRFQFDQIQVHYTDSVSGNSIHTFVEVLSSKFKFKNDKVYVDLDSKMDLDIWEYGEPTYFTGKKLNLEVEFQYDLLTTVLDIVPSKVKLDQAEFKVKGSIDVDDDFMMDIIFEGDKPDFNIFGAFAPKAVEDALKGYKNAGKIFFRGTIQGKSTNGEMPLVEVDFGCENAWFVNTGVNRKLNDINFKGKFTTGEGRSLTTSSLQLTNFYARPDQGIFQGNLFIRNFRDPYFKINLHADLDLEFLGQFFQLENLKHVKGKILLDMDFDEMIDLEFPAENLAQLKSGIDSDLQIMDLQFEVPGYPLMVKQMNGHAFMREGEITLDSLRFKVGESDFNFSGSLSDFPALIHRQDKDIIVKLDAFSRRLDFKELLGKDAAGKYILEESIEKFVIKVAFNTKASELFQYKYLPKGEFFIDDFYAKFERYPHTLHDFHADIIITEEDFELIDFSGEIDDSDFHFNGKLVNYSKWFQDEPKGDSKLEFDWVSNQLRLDDILSYNGTNYVPEEYRHEVFTGLKLHGRVDMHYDGGFQSVDLYLDRLDCKMKAHPLKLERFSGAAHYEEDKLSLNNFKGKMGRSDFLVNLEYYYGAKAAQNKSRNRFELQSQILDLDALMGYKGVEHSVNHEDSFNFFEVPFPDLQLDLYVGKLNYHKYWLEQFKVKGKIQSDHMIYLDTMQVNVADGGLAMKGYFNGMDPKNIYLTSTIRATHLDLDKLLFKLDNFGQDIMINEFLKGQISGTITSTVKLHPDLTPILEDTKADLDIMVKNGSLHRFAPLQAASRFFKDKNLNLVRFDTLANRMVLQNGELDIPNMRINSSLGFMEIAGKHRLDMQMDYTIRLPLRLVTQVGWRSLFGSKSREEIDPDQIDEIISPQDGKRIAFLTLRVTGTPDSYNIAVGKGRKRDRGPLI
jgi:hypothetical protein